MRELGSMLAAVAVFFGLLLALIVAWAVYWFYVKPLVTPPLSPVLAFVRPARRHAVLEQLQGWYRLGILS